MNKIQSFLPLIPVAGLVFQAGRQSEKLEELFLKAYALEGEQKNTRELLFDIHGKVCTIEQELRDIGKKLA